MTFVPITPTVVAPPSANAQELANALYEVVNLLEERDRSFVPFKVSPPPNSQGGRQERQDSMAVITLSWPRLM